MSPAKRRVAVDHLIGTFAVSQRRACTVVGQPRSTQRMPATLPTPAEQHLRARLRELATARPRYGYRRLHALLTREGYQVNHKRVGGFAVMRVFGCGLRNANAPELAPLQLQVTGCVRSAPTMCGRWISSSIRLLIVERLSI